jgi:uncharacterized protein YecT (DUF1311 family)
MTKILAVTVVVLLIGTASPCMADPAELDDWCLQSAKLPSSIALCSDSELRELAIQRNHAFEAARARLSVDAYDALQRDQKGWVHSYSTACGISETIPPILPLPAQMLECMKRAGRSRVEYLWNYLGGTPNASPAKPADIVVPTARYVSPPPAPRCQDVGCLSRQLQEDMTESEVTSIFGYRPNMITMETCGSQLENGAGAWRCKIYHFGTLRVLFRNSDGIWVVNSWF